MMSEITVTRARDIVASITRDDDGAHVVDLMRLLKMSGAEDTIDGEEAMKSLYMQTNDFNEHYEGFKSRL